MAGKTKSKDTAKPKADKPEAKPKGKVFGFAVFEGLKYLLTYKGEGAKDKATSLAGKKPTVGGLERKMESVSKERYKKLEREKAFRIRRIERKKDRLMEKKGKMPETYHGEIA